MKRRDKQYLYDLAAGLETAERTVHGTDPDVEGYATITLSDKLTKSIVEELRRIGANDES